ncbi:MAG: hypothetical protein HYV75_01375 [Opitutae bacterium]|nr:hypothetical protein [Opitutae bacterium]
MIGRDTLAFRTLLEIAHLRPDIDEQRCRLVLEFLSTAGTVQAALHRDLAVLHLTELKLSVLAVLFLLHPSPSTPADLAAHTGVTRSARDRRTVYIHLTKAGQQAAEGGLVRYLGSVTRSARYVQPRTFPRLRGLCARLNEGTGRAVLAP